jgi:phosphodiesterase/alkaline phosphatase D-like protein
VAQAATPEQIHTAFAGDTGMTVSWATDGDAGSTVNYGTKASTLTSKATGSSSTYTKPMFHHHTTLTGLKENTKYYYKVGDASGESAVMSFTTAPKPGDKGKFSASIFGDWGYGSNGHATATKSALDKIHDEVKFVWHLGTRTYPHRNMNTTNHQPPTTSALALTLALALALALAL